MAHLGVSYFATVIPSCSFTFARVIPSCSFTFARVIPTLFKFFVKNFLVYLFTLDHIDPNIAKTSLGVTVTMEITNVGTQGYPGVGKTSVLDLAMGKELAPTRTSTDCIDPPSRYLMIDSAIDGVEWENVTTDKMFQMVCEAAKKTIEDNHSPDTEEPLATASRPTSNPLKYRL